MTTLTHKTPAKSRLWPDHSLSKRIGVVLAGFILLALSAQISIPLQPVPLTFQSATVVLIGLAVGSRYASAIICAYFLAGICGAPVFADLSFGPLVFLGPTGGYLAAFLPAAYLTGYLAENGVCKSLLSSWLVACLGVAVIFTAGLLRLGHFLPWNQVLQVGLYPFVLSESLKLIVLAYFIPKLWK